MDTDMSALLPDDLLADVLGRLAPRDLAVSRAVCKLWRAVVDAHHLLRKELLPHWLGGIFINFHNYSTAEFFARPPPATGSKNIVSGQDYYQDDMDLGSTVLDHCNGLVLVHDDYVDGQDVVSVLNPATGWRASVPPCPRPCVELDTSQEQYLAYDPAISPHYEVFSIPRFRSKRKPGDFGYDSIRDKVDTSLEQSEWPPTRYKLHVFSSVSGQWGERTFVREGEAAGIIADMRDYWPWEQRNAVCWRRALYVHCPSDSVIRLSLVENKCHVIKRPPGIEAKGYPQFHLGKSEKGVYCASIHERCKLRVWILNESSGQMEWELKHERSLHEWLLTHKLVDQRYGNSEQQIGGPWILQDINYYSQHCNEESGDTEALVEEEFEWSSDASDVEEFDWNLNTNDGKYYHGYIDILGFHPYKEIIFLSEYLSRGLAYHLKGSKVQELGNLYPKNYGEELPNEQFIISSFPYTPCWMKNVSEDDDLEDDYPES